MSLSPSRQKRQKRLRAIIKSARRGPQNRSTFHGWFHCPFHGAPVWGTRISFEKHKENCAVGRRRKVKW